ncbi:MAG: ribonuclease P protein component [Clostridia bacterium]|nr:ribonuclease P protein component [Clostridia bacterium]
MTGTIPLKTNSDFRRAYTRGKAYTDPALVTYVRKNRAGICRIGITASKKIGNAVERNRARRVIRAAAEMLPSFSSGYDIVFVARTRTVSRKSTQIKEIMSRQLTSAGVIHE